MAQLYTEITKDLDFTFEYIYLENNLEQTPTSPTAIVYDNGGTQVDTITGSVSGNTMSFLFPSASNTATGRNFRLEMSFTVSGESKKVQYLFDVVNVAITNGVNDEDLFERVKDLRDITRFRSETTAEGTTTTFIDAELQADRRKWAGGFGELLFTDITVENLSIQATAYDATTGTITFNPAHSVNVPAGTPYIMRLSYQAEIDNAFRFVMTRVRNLVGLLAGYIDTNVINDLVVFRALKMICMGESDQEGDKWDRRVQYYEAEFSSIWNNFNEAYDKDEDGNISDDENDRRPSFGTIQLTR